MEKDRERSGSSESKRREEEAGIDYAQHARLLRLAEGLGLKGETLAHLRASLLPLPLISPLRINPSGVQRPESPLPARTQEGFSYRQAASSKESPPASVPGKVTVPITELAAYDPQANQRVDRNPTRPPHLPSASPARGVPSAYPRLDPMSLSLPEPPASLAPESGREQPTKARAVAPAPVPAVETPSPSVPVATREVRAQPRLDLALEAELKLRQRIEAEQSWTAFRGEAWKLYESFPRPDMAARLLELAFLYGSAGELEEVLGSLLRDGVEFYLLIEAQIRQHMVIKLWQAKRRSVLDGLLFRKEISLRLLPLERLYCCWSLIKTDEGAQAFRYFKRFDHEIWAAQKHFGPQIKQSESEMALELGRLALQANEEATAIRLLETIPKQAEEFQKALDILLDLRVERDAQGLCAYGQKLQRELDWRGRLGLLDSFLLRIQRFEASAPKDRAALNELLKDPLKWFPETPEAWQGVAEILLQYQQLHYLLPHILHLFHQKAAQFHKPSFDHAIWAEVAKHDFGDELKNWFWHSIAQLHEFTWSLGQKEPLLWEARRLYHEARAHTTQDLPISWSVLHKGLLQWIHKTDRLEETQRQQLQVLAKLLGEAQEISEADVCSYLSQVSAPSREVMDALENLARERQQWGLESFVLDRKAQLLHYTNHDLGRMWQLATQLKRYDQCWRVASLLRSRLVLHEGLEKHWSICGEKKREFTVLELQESHIKKITSSFDGYERRFAEALVSVGPLLPELLAILNPHLVPLKKGRGLSDTELEIHQALERMSALSPSKRLLSPHPSGLWHSKPPFFASLLDTKWSLVFMALAQRLGIPTWDWQLSLLHHQIESIIPRMTRGVELPHAGKIGRWLRSLSPQQRKSWYDLAQIGRRFDDEAAQLLMARLLAKMTTTMLQDHPLALQSLEKMRAPLRMRWDLEHWIASETYGELRRSLGSCALGHYPEEVYKGSAVVQRSGSDEQKS